MAHRQPNILYILADDLGWGDVGYHGSPARTPNLDRLAREGVELDQHYVCPVCTPTRACLMTGNHPGRFGSHATIPTVKPVMRPGQPTVASILKSAGYDTALIGKWHLGVAKEYIPNHWGFDHSYGCLSGCIDPYTHEYWNPDFSGTWHRNGETVPEQGHATDLILKEAQLWLRSRDPETPWFCYVPFTAVHEPVKVPQEWYNRYLDVKFDPDPARDHSFRKYAAYTSQMDWAVGQLIDTLEEICQRADTLVVFISDNGAITRCNSPKKWPGYQEVEPRLGSNLPLRGNKSQLYDGGMRTPALVSWQGTLSPRKVTAPLHMVDWLPTLAGLCGADVPADLHLDGQDIMPVLTGADTAPAERTFYWNMVRQDFAVRKGDWKLIILRDGTEELYNMTADPYEKNECLEEHPAVAEELRQVLAEQRQADDMYIRDDMK